MADPLIILQRLGLAPGDSDARDRADAARAWRDPSLLRLLGWRRAPRRPGAP